MGASIEASCDTPPIFAFGKNVFGPGASTIERPVVGMAGFLASARRDAGFDVFGGERLAEWALSYTAGSPCQMIDEHNRRDSAQSLTSQTEPKPKPIRRYPAEYEPLSKPAFVEEGRKT